MHNMAIYEKVRSVPQEAKKTIGAGRLKGMTDINPMWRIKMLTEQFGICGIGWYYEVEGQWIEEVGDERVAFVNINLYIKVDGEWSQPIFGTGGSKLSTVERNGVYVSDECYKMATTDAISVACKNLGMGADVYWDKDRTKYSPVTQEQKEEADDVKKTEEVGNMKIAEIKQNVLLKKCADEDVDVNKLLKIYGLTEVAEITEKDFRDIRDNWTANKLKIKEM